MRVGMGDTTLVLMFMSMFVLVCMTATVVMVVIMLVLMFMLMFMLVGVRVNLRNPWRFTRQTTAAISTHYSISSDAISSSRPARISPLGLWHPGHSGK